MSSRLEDVDVGLAAYIKDLIRRVETLEKSPQLVSSSMREGTLRILDAQGNTRVRVGLLDIEQQIYGISIYDGSEGLRFEVNDDGYRDPWLAHPWRNQQTPDSIAVTSGAFIDVWTTKIGVVTHLGASTEVNWVTDAGTTGEIRLRDGLGNVTSAVALPSGASGVRQLNWLHGLPLGTGPGFFAIQARRIGGAGSVRLDEPGSALYMTDPLSCTPTGL